MQLSKGNTYRWKYDNLILTYLGSKGGWYQFAIYNTEVVYCEVLESDLHLMEVV